MTRSLRWGFIGASNIAERVIASLEMVARVMPSISRPS